MILKLEQQVCSLESSKRLKELGLQQESLFYWSWDKCTDTYNLVYVEDLKKCFESDDFDEYSAYTVAELGVLIPHYGRTDKDRNYWLNLQDLPEAEARAKMLIYVLENGLINKE